MNNKSLYGKIEIPGSFLIPGFSIYVLEIIKGSNRWFYIGMTGDNYYPRARAAFYRLAGHLEITDTSTQNQLLTAIREKLKIKSESDFKKLKIIMHHFPIEGYKPVTDAKLSKENMRAIRKSKKYKDYKKLQKDVAMLETALIYELAPKLLNKTGGRNIESNAIPFLNVYYNVVELINNKQNAEPGFAEVKNGVNYALNLLYENDEFLITNTTNERTITHKLAVYLQQYFTDWNVDCEYNRAGKNKKTLSNQKTSYPDIIIHQRNTQNNLLIIEVKKQNVNNTDIKSDKIKIKDFIETKEYNYKYGLFIKLNIEQIKTELNFYKNEKGKCVEVIDNE